MNPDVYKGIWGGAKCRDSIVQTTRSCNCPDNTCEAADKYAEQVEIEFHHNIAKGHLAAFFAESIQGLGGIVQFPKGYLKKISQLVRQHGGVFIADEVTYCFVGVCKVIF